MLVFFDTEFTEIGLDPKLISIGLITEDGAHTFYAELSDTYQTHDCSPFVQEAVLPHLQGGLHLMDANSLSLRLGNWIEGLEHPVQLATDSMPYDWPWIQELFCLPGVWPQNLHAKPASLYDITNSTFFDHAVELVDLE